MQSTDRKMQRLRGPHIEGWPEPCIYTVHDCMFGETPAKSTVYTPCVYI